MPIGGGDYDVVIGVNIKDDTEKGAHQVRNNYQKLTEDVRRAGEINAREYARRSRDIFDSTDRSVTRTSDHLVRRLVHVFDSHNFLLRNLARQAGSTTAAVAIGVGKLGLSYHKLGTDTENASRTARIATEEIRDAVSRLGSDPNALPAAIASTRILSKAFEDMGKTGHAASVKAGGVIEDAIHKRILNLQKGLGKAQLSFELLRIKASDEATAIADKINDIAASVSHLLGGVPINAPFFKAFIKASDDAERYKLVLNKLGPTAAVKFHDNQNAVNKLADAYIRLDSRSTKALKNQADNLTNAANKVVRLRHELDTVDKSLIHLTASSTGASTALKSATGSMGGFSLVAVATAGAIALAVAAVAALVVGIIAFTVISVKSANAAGKYGDEIYKLSLSTGLSVKTLSGLTVIARETGTELDSLAKTFTRMQIQIQRGLDAPMSEAGRAIRTLKVDLVELRKANPDQQVFTLAKAFGELNNQNVRAAVAAQLFSRDAERQSKILEQIANGFTIAQQKAKKYGIELDENGAVKAHLYTVAVQDLKLAWEGFWIRVGMMILPEMTGLLEDFTREIVGVGGAFQGMGGLALYWLREIRVEFGRISAAMQVMQAMGTGPESAAWGAYVYMTSESEVRDKLNKEGMERKAEYDKRAEELRRRGLQGDDEYAKGKGARTPKTDLENLRDQVRKLRFEIGALQQVGSEPFKLRFELEELQKVKSNFESIFKLRHEMGLVLDTPLPQFRIFGTPEEQQLDIQNIQSYLDQVQRMKTVFDGIRKVANEQADALAKLAQVQQESLMPVVDAGTLAQIKYYEAVRERTKAEKELTAEVISDAKLRKDAIEDEIGATLKAYMTLQRDTGRSQDSLRDQRKQDELFIRIFRGGTDEESRIRESIAERIGSTSAPVVPTELQAIAAHAATIDLNVASIAEKIGANVKNVSQSTLTSAAKDTSYAGVRSVIRNADGTISVVDSSQEETEKVDSTTESFLRTKIMNEAMAKASGERVTAERTAIQSIIEDSARMTSTLIDYDTDYLRHFTARQVSRRDEARQTGISIELISTDLRDLENENSELYVRTWDQANKTRFEGYLSLKNEIIQIQNDIAHNGEDSADREKRAYVSAIREIQEEDNTARESMIRSQVQLADATIYHVDRANGKVLEYLASQRDLTDVIADAKIGIVDGVFNAISFGLDRAYSKLGAMKGLIKELTEGFIRIGLTQFFQKLYGLSAGQTSGGGGVFQGIGGSPLNIASVFSGGGGGGRNLSTGQAFGSPDIGALASNYFSAGGAGIQSSGTLSGQASSSSSLQNILRQTSGGGTGSTGLLGAGGLMGTLRGAAPALPFLGLGLGSGLGGQSRFGSILGGAGGLLLGGVGALALAPGFLASTLGGTFGIAGGATGVIPGSMGALGSTITGLLSNPFTIAAGVALLATAFFVGRSKKRRKEEEIRSNILISAKTQMQSLIDSVRRGRPGSISPGQALATAQQIRSEYINAVNTQITDGKTKRIALETVRELDYMINVQLNQAIAESIDRANRSDQMKPEFAEGGGVWTQFTPFNGLLPGMYDKSDRFKINVSGNEVVLNPGQWGPITPYLKSANVPGFNAAMPPTRSYAGGGGVMMGGMASDLPVLEIDNLEINFDDEGLAKVVIKSRHFKTAVIHSVRAGQKEKKIA